VKSRNFVLAVVGAGLALGGVAAPAASADTPGDVSVQAVSRKSAKCTSPSDKKINISWGAGATNTTVYYNNHCNQSRTLTFGYWGVGGSVIYKCFVAPAGKKGKKVLDMANPFYAVIGVNSSC
jgi:hypothetical protein